MLWRIQDDILKTYNKNVMLMHPYRTTVLPALSHRRVHTYHMMPYLCHFINGCMHYVTCTVAWRGNVVILPKIHSRKEVIYHQVSLSSPRITCGRTTVGKERLERSERYAFSQIWHLGALFLHFLEHPQTKTTTDYRWTKLFGGKLKTVKMTVDNN